MKVGILAILYAILPGTEIDIFFLFPLLNTVIFSNCTCETLNQVGVCVVHVYVQEGKKKGGGV